MLTKNLTQTYIDIIQLSTLVTEDFELYDRASKTFDAAIAQGQTLAQIQGLRMKLQEYSAKKVRDSSDLINKTAAYQSSLQIAAQSEDAKGILDVVAHMQAIVSRGAKSNELVRNLIEAKNVAYQLSIDDTAAQSELLLAQSALEIATANGTIVQEKYDAIVTASNRVAITRNKLSAANAAVALANSYVNMDPNVQALQDIAEAVYNLQNETAQANVLSEQYFAAKKAEAVTYAALDVAKKNLETASALFDTAISSGTDINAIQKARDELNAAASQMNAANSAQTYAKAALNTALANANLSQTAQALITTARVTDANVVAGANVTTEQYKLDLLKEDLAKATAVSTASSAASNSAKAVLDNASSSGMTAQEILELRQSATAAAEKASDDMQTMRNLQEKVLEQQSVVDKFTEVFEGTQAEVATNNLINYMLFNGFSFQQSIDRYVLNKDMVPATVAAGVNIILFSQTIIPVDMGVYSDTTTYPIGNIVTYPDDSSAQYMCLVGTDPRGAAFSSVTGKNPVDVPVVWAKIQEAQLRYRSATDLAVANFTKATNYSITAPLTGDMLGLKTLFTNSDANGSNTLINGLMIFGDSLPNSTPVNAATITGIAYNALRTTVTISFSQPLGSVSSQSVLYIKSSKSIVDAAVLAYNTYVTNLLAAGFTPVTELGSLTKSVMNRSALPTPITVGTPFSLGTTTVTPTSKGVYSAATSYRTGDVVTDTYGSVYMCTVGPDSRGTSFAVTVGNAPVEAPGASVYWYTLVNQGWDTLVYNSAVDLELTPVAFGTGQLYWTSADYPANPNMQLAASFLSGYTIFGTGVYQRNVITNLSYGYSGATYAYIFTCGETNKNTSQKFYVKNGKLVISTATTAGVFNTLSTTIASAASQVNTILSKTTTAEAAAVNANIATLRTSVLEIQTAQSGNASVTPVITLALSIIDECVKAGKSAANLLSLYLQAVAGSVTGEIADLTAAKTSGSGNITTIVTAMNTASTHYTNQNLVGAQTQLTTIQTTNATLAATSTQYEYYFTAPTQTGYTLFATAGSGVNQGLPMANSVRAYIETPTQSNLWNIDTSDYTLEFITTAGDNFNNVGQLIDRFAQNFGPAGTILMGLNAASNSGTNLALANWVGWRGLLGFNGNNNIWGPLFTNSNENAYNGNFMANASNIYNFGTGVQNHYCEVRKNNVQTMYLNGNQVMQYSTIYSAPSNSVILPSSNTNPAMYGPTPPYWQIGGSDRILNQAGNPWVGGLRNIRLSKEAVYTSSFNTTSTIRGPDSVYFKNLECLSTTILLMPMNDGRMLKDYSLAKLRVSTMGFSSNINSNIKFLSSFGTVSSFSQMGISPVCYLPLSTNTSNIGTDGYAPVISGTVNTYSTISLRRGVLFTGNWANAITATFNPTSNLTMTCWYYGFANRVGLGLYGGSTAGSVYSFYNTYGSPEGSGTGFGWWNINPFEGYLPGGMNLGYGMNSGIGSSPDKAKAWNQIGFVMSTTTTGVVCTYAYMNGTYQGSNGHTYGPTTSNYNSFINMNKITIGRNERIDNQQVSPWNGLFKEVMIFNRGLTKTEMLALYTEQLYNQRNN
jgi:hypothetical protein